VFVILEITDFTIKESHLWCYNLTLSTFYGSINLAGTESWVQMKKSHKHN